VPQFSKWLLSFGLSHQNLVHFPVLSHACHMPAHLILLDLICVMVCGGEYKLLSPPLCNFFRSPIILFLLVQIFSLASCFQIPSMDACLLMWETKFHIINSNWQNYGCVYFNIYVHWWRAGTQKKW
jgi:hypothetical protein